MNEMRRDKFSDELINNLKDAELGHNYFNIRVKYADVAKRAEEGGGGSGGGDMLKADYDPDNDGKVEKADYADNAGYANNSGKLNNHSDTDFMFKADYDSDGDGKVDNAENADNAQTLQGKEPTDFADINHTHKIEDLSNVNISSPTDSQVIAYNETNSEWVNKTIPDGDMKKSVYDPDGDGKVENADYADNANNANTLQGNEPSDFAPSNHSHTLDELNNVNILNPNDGQALIYDGNNNVWKNSDVSSGGGGDMYKSTYDPDNDGKVENADHADTADNANTLQGNEPSAFANANHTHSVEDLSDTEVNSPEDGHILYYSNGKWVNASSAHSHYIEDLVDVNISNPSDGQVLAYDSQNNDWKNITINTGGGGSSTLAGLSDTDINNPQDNQCLLFSNGKWINSNDVMLKSVYDPAWDGKVDKANYADNAGNTDKVRGLPADFTCSKQQNGYTKLPNGLIIQWGKITVNVTNTDAHWEANIQNTFPIQFPNAVFSITMTRDNYNSADIFVPDFRLKNINKYGFYFDFLVQAVATTGTVNWFWMAIGH